MRVLSNLWLQRIMLKVGKILVFEVSRTLNRFIWLHIRSSTFPTNHFSHPPVVRTAQYAQIAPESGRFDTCYDAKERLGARKYSKKSRMENGVTSRALQRSIWLFCSSSLLLMNSCAYHTAIHRWLQNSKRTI